MPSCSRNFRLLQTAELKTEFAEGAKADRDIVRYAGVPVTSQCSGPSDAHSVSSSPEQYLPCPTTTRAQSSAGGACESDLPGITGLFGNPRSRSCGDRD